MRLKKIYDASARNENPPNAKIIQSLASQDGELAKDALFVARSPLKLYDEFLKYLRDI